MSEDENEQPGNQMVEDGNRIAGVIGPLLECLGTLSQIARHLHPATLPKTAGLAQTVAEPLRTVQTGIDDWPDHLEPLGNQLQLTCESTLKAFDELQHIGAEQDGIMLAYRALRHLPRAMEALYPLAGLFPPVSQFFLDDGHTQDDGLINALSGVAPDGTGVFAVGKDVQDRATVWIYVPENIDALGPVPVIFALHGGGGKGRGFLWSWLRTARSRGAILVAPTSLGGTWALQGEDIDSPHLAETLAFVQEHWSVDPKRLLLTGMSDGGTFSYVSGLLADSPFTHLAPFSAAFHPMLGSFADPERLKGLPVHITHGALDWMFPTEMAKMAQEWLAGAGAQVIYREIADLSHTYASEMNSEIFDWMESTADD